MNRFDARRRRPLPEPAGQRGDVRRRTGGDDFDAPVGEVLHPTVDLQALQPAQPPRRGSRRPARGQRRYSESARLALTPQSSAPGRGCVERSAWTARFFARTAFMRAGAVGFLLDLPLGVFQEPPSVGKRIGREPAGIGLLCGS